MAAYTDKKGNKITVQSNGLVSIKRRNESTYFYDLDELCSALTYLRKHGFFVSDSNDVRGKMREIGP